LAYWRKRGGNRKAKRKVEERLEDKDRKKVNCLLLNYMSFLYNILE
jgi:hypothetical protein